MISIGGWLNPTRSIGLTAYLFAVTSCSIVWARGFQSPRRTQLAAILTVLYAALFLDMIFNGRWLLHEALKNEAVARNLYNHRFGPQLVTLGLVAASTALGIRRVMQRYRDRSGALTAASGAIFSCVCWCVEVISLHITDEVLYHKVDDVMLASLIWVACSLMAGLGILWDLRAA